jgi:hypothetical protein
MKQTRITDNDKKFLIQFWKAGYILDRFFNCDERKTIKKLLKMNILKEIKSYGYLIDRITYVKIERIQNLKNKSLSHFFKEIKMAIAG